MAPSWLQVGAASAALPDLGLGFDASFLEEPVMLLAFVLLGWALEAQAKARQAQAWEAPRGAAAGHAVVTLV